MSEVSRVVGAPPERVFAALRDGWSYPLWVVGASHMRAVDDGWPAVGTCLHHSVGAWPVLIEDTTEVLEMEPDRRLLLAARAWPSGTARVEIVLEPTGSATTVRMRERAASGPATLIPGVVQTALLVPRNRESLSRLDALVTNRQDHRA